MEEAAAGRRRRRRRTGNARLSAADVGEETRARGRRFLRRVRALPRPPFVQMKNTPGSPSRGADFQARHSARSTDHWRSAAGTSFMRGSATFLPHLPLAAYDARHERQGHLEACRMGTSARAYAPGRVRRRRSGSFRPGRASRWRSSGTIGRISALDRWPICR
jgi:hypothetical protein